MRLLKNFTTIYGNRRFITIFTRTLYRSLFRARSSHFILPHPISLWSILILSIHLPLGLPGGHFPSGFHTNFIYAFLFFPICATCLDQHILLDLIILITLGGEWILCSSSLCSLKLIYHLYKLPILRMPGSMAPLPHSSSWVSAEAPCHFMSRRRATNFPLSSLFRLCRWYRLTGQVSGSHKTTRLPLFAFSELNSVLQVSEQAIKTAV
jgi:hypothetical protein